MSLTLYVGNISYKMKETDLIDVFSQIGQVENAKIVFDKKTHRSKGYAFVTLKNDIDADKAVEQFNGREVFGRNIKVSVAKQQTAEEI